MSGVRPDLYSGRGIRCVLATIRTSGSGSGEAQKDIEAARQWLHTLADCTGKIGIIDVCMGGSFALLGAPRYAFPALSVNCGVVPKDAVERLVGACPIRGSYGKRDRGLPRPRRAPRESAHIGANCEHPAAEDAWRRILEFYATRLT